MVYEPLIAAAPGIPTVTILQPIVASCVDLYQALYRAIFNWVLWNQNQTNFLPISQTSYSANLKEGDIWGYPTLQFCNYVQCTVFPVKRWTPEKIYVYCFTINQMQDETTKDNGQTAAGISHGLIWNNELALSSTRNLQFSLWIPLKKLFFAPNQH